MKLEAALGIRLLALAALLLMPVGSALMDEAEGTAQGMTVLGPSTSTALTPLAGIYGKGAVEIHGTTTLDWGQFYSTRYYRAGVSIPGEEVATPLMADRACEEFYTEKIFNNKDTQCTNLEHIDAVGSLDLEGVASAGTLQIRFFSLDGAPFEISSTQSKFGGEQAPGVFADGGIDLARLEEDVRPSLDSQNEVGPDAVWPHFSERLVALPSVFMDATSYKTALTIEGDFIMEVFGAEVHGSSNGADPAVWKTGWAQQDAGPADESVRIQDFVFLRLALEDASIQLDVGPNIFVEAAAASVSMSSETSGLQLQGASSSLAQIGETDDDEVIIPAPYEARILAAANALSVGVAPMGDTQTPAAPGFMEKEGIQWALWIAAAVLFTLAIGAIVIRQSTTPPLPSIEAALEEGHYRKAAKLSSRVLRRNPSQESAQLARAIAWSRMGAHDRIIQHLQPFLQRHEPSDGTIHYVLGLALHEVGDDDEARRAMASAVSRTPSLLSEIEPDLRIPASDPSGYS